MSILLPAICASQQDNAAIVMVLGDFLTLVGCAIARRWFILILKK
ncbi:MAG: hypothetical protein RMY28_005500 [Nostoc sp. ChiSLP01]